MKIEEIIIVYRTVNTQPYTRSVKIHIHILIMLPSKAAKKSLASHQLPRLIFTTTEKELHSSSNTQSWEECEMHAFF